MAIAIRAFRNEKSFESNERPKRFLLETKRKEIMKPTIITNKDARKFPFVDYNYHSATLKNFSGSCVKTKSLHRIGRDYFAVESNREFLSDAAVFGALIVSCAVPIIIGLSAVISLPLF